MWEKFQGFVSETLREKFFFFNSLGTTNISTIFKLSAYIHVVLLINFTGQLKLPYPEFHFETETKVGSLTGVQRYKGNYVLNGCLQHSLVCRNEAKVSSIDLTSNLCN